ncbi:hypothetical protein ACQ4LE_007879 [Meloidogyne hapla]|uniref:Prisilkin-39-like n=1 Tax=Meloidogyne hapla TaxID=6305 RepID=A0A1I8B9U6_MELHA
MTILTFFLIISIISFQTSNAYNPYKYGPIGWALVHKGDTGGYPVRIPTVTSASYGYNRPSYGYNRPATSYGYRPSTSYGYNRPVSTGYGYRYRRTSSYGYGGTNYAISYGYPSATPNGYPPNYGYERR